MRDGHLGQQKIQTKAQAKTRAMCLNNTQVLMIRKHWTFGLGLVP